MLCKSTIQAGILKIAKLAPATKSTIQAFIMKVILKARECSKGRTRANLEVTELQYKAALHELFFSAPPVLDMKAKLGPNLVSHVKQVIPGALLALHKIVMPLIQGGWAVEIWCCNRKKVLVSLHTTVAERKVLAPQGTHCFFIASLDTCNEGPHHAVCSNDESFEK